MVSGMTVERAMGRVDLDGDLEGGFGGLIWSAE